MKVCVNCAEEMKCMQIGLGVRYGESHVYPGDLFQCPKCHATIIVTNDNPVTDPDNRISTLQMDGDRKGEVIYNYRP